MLRLCTCVLLLNLFIILNSTQICLNEVNNRKYFLVKKCRRLETGIISRGNFDTPIECMIFAREKNGLAINYSPKGSKGLRKGYSYNCEVLGCPDNSNLTALAKDANYDYYSSYGNISALINSTCIKSVGMFKIFQEKTNYTTAIDKCQQEGADLANILTETRTNALSNYINYSLKNWYKASFVGLEDIETEGSYKTPIGDSIMCYKFRAWSPGHPRTILRSDDCVAINSERSWVLVNCKIKLSFLCEFYPSSPAKETNYADVDCDELDSIDEEDKCIEWKRRMGRRRRRNRCDDD